MRFSALLICLTGVDSLPAGLAVVEEVIFGMMGAVAQHQQINPMMIANVAPPVFQQAGTGAVLFW